MFGAPGLSHENQPILAKMVSIDIDMSLSYEKKTTTYLKTHCGMKCRWLFPSEFRQLLLIMLEPKVPTDPLRC